MKYKLNARRKSDGLVQTFPCNGVYDRSQIPTTREAARAEAKRWNQFNPHWHYTVVDPRGPGHRKPRVTPVVAPVVTQERI